MFTLNEFITYLKLSKAYTTKQLIVIDYIAIYISDACVYKVIIATKPAQMSKAKKLGLNQFKTIYFDSPVKLVDSAASTIGFGSASPTTPSIIAQGKYIIMYYPNTCNEDRHNYQIYSGEVDESEQLQSIHG